MDTTTAWSRVDKRKIAERFAVEMGPALVFVVALQALSLNAATVAFVLATGVTAAWSWIERRRFPVMPFAMVAFAAAFGAATIAFDSADYIQFRATLLNVSGAVALVVGLATGHLLLKTSLEEGFRLDDGAWRTLTIRMAVYLLLTAAANEVMWRGFSVEAWGWFKAAMPVLNLAFLGLNWPLIRDHLRAERTAAPASAPVPRAAGAAR